MRSDRAKSFRGALLASAIALTAFAACAQAQTYNLRVIHRFSGAPNDGSTPFTGVQFDSAGNLYGTTDHGGTYDKGTVFKIAKDGTETIVHSFNGPAAYINPGEVTIDPATGDVYGTAEGGGENEYGQIYKLAVDGTFTVLHTFDGALDGEVPNSPLLLDPLGSLYGTARGGGSNGFGVVFKLAPDGTFTVLHAFTGLDGDGPWNGVIRDQAGNLYGVTEEGGVYNGGTVYKLVPDGTLTTLHSFPGGADGTPPTDGPLVGDHAGNLYGTVYDLQVPTLNSRVYKLAPDGAFTTLYTFTGGADGTFANALLSIGGNFYGTTPDGGDHHFGVVFKLIPDGTFTVLHAFTLRDGVYPGAGLTLKYGRLFGTTASSVARNNVGGTVFSLSAVR
jgi:uncharacterized repeat protein (TIGR03803 family)